LQIEELPEVKKQVTALINISEEKLNIINKFSSLTRLKRTYCLRFAYNTNKCIKDNGSKLKGPLQVEELERSMQTILRIAQKEEFADV